MWQLLINGVDVTAKTGRVQVTFSADSVSGQITVDLVDRSVIDGLVIPRVPQALLLAYRHSPSHPVMHFYLEEPKDLIDPDSRQGQLWGRSGSARLTAPWAPKISKQWPGGGTIASTLAEVASICGVAVNIAEDYNVCQYCYAVSDQSPAEIIRDLATRSGQILWPRLDGSVDVAPRLYAYGTPDVVLDQTLIDVESVTRTAPDFGSRILVSGDAAVAGLTVAVVPVYAEDTCVPADGESIVRLVAVVLDADGTPVASGTTVHWSADGGSMGAETSVTSVAMVTGELQRADSYKTVRLDLPPASVVGVYDYIDYRRVRNLYDELGGSVSGNVITFASSLKYYDQALIIDYDVAAATNEWIAGYVPGDVTITASVAGAQGMCSVHQSNPVACSSQIALECVPSDVCIGSKGAILAKVGMFGGPGRGPAVFSIEGCGSLSSSRKTLGQNVVRELLRTSTWGGVSQINLSAYPVDGTIKVYQPAYPAVELYASHKGRLVNLAALADSGTQMAVEYTADGTAMVSWVPSGIVAGTVLIREWLETTDDGTSSFVELSTIPTTAKSTPVALIIEDPIFTLGPNLYGSHAGQTVTLNDRLDAGTPVHCTYWVDQPLQPDCTATITVHVEDGSQDGGEASISVRARDCRVQSTDPITPVDESSEDDPATWPDRLNIPDVYGPCDPEMILPRTPSPNGMNWEGVVGVETASDCPGLCTCDQICTALRSAGELAKAGYFWSQCMTECEAARERKCAPCDVTGPETLSPGEVGTWDDGKSNAGEYSGDLKLISQSELGGYELQMPAGGEGPFEIKFCYDRTPESCCTATVDFPACGLSGPSVLDPDEEGLYTAAQEITPGNPALMLDGLIEVRRTSAAITAVLADESCGGSITAVFGGVACPPKLVASSVVSDMGAVTGPGDLGPGETGTFFYAFSPSNNLDGLEYTGTLEYVADVSGGVVLRMPADAGISDVFTASWSASCDRSASKSVVTVPECTDAIPSFGDGYFTVGDVVRFPAASTNIPGDPDYIDQRMVGDAGVYTQDQCGVVLDIPTGRGILADYFGYTEEAWGKWLTQRCVSVGRQCDPTGVRLYIVSYVTIPEYHEIADYYSWPYEDRNVVGGIYT